jgi:small subunit ribosomal protein S17
MTVAAAPLVAVGEVLKPHGLTGEVKVRSLSDRTEDRFRRLRECILWEPRTDRREACRIASCRVEGEQTVLVRIDRQVRHPLYGKTVRRSSKLAAHDEQNDAHVGDTVRVMETRPLSKTKRWRLVEIVERAK